MDAWVQAAKVQGLDHSGMHSEVEYVVAHGIATRIDGERAVIGSSHFVFEDEGVKILPEDKAAYINEEHDAGRTVIMLGAFGLLTPAASALLHNSTTLLLSMNCLTGLLED